MTHGKAMLCALTAFFFWVAFDALVKISSMSSVSPFAIVGILGVVGVIWIGGQALYRRDLSSLRTQHPWQQAFIALGMASCLCTNAVALKHLPLTIFYIVVFTEPLVLAIVVVLLKYEILTKTKVACLVVGFLGVMIVIAPRLALGGEWIGYLAGSASVAGFTVTTILTSQISSANTPQSLLFWVFIAMLLSGILFAAPEMVALPLKGWIILATAGAFNTYSYSLYNKALRHTSATNVMQLHYTQIIFGAVVGYFLWHEIPTWNLAIGSVLIIASGMVVAAQASKS